MACREATSASTANHSTVHRVRLVALTSFTEQVLARSDVAGSAVRLPASGTFYIGRQGRPESAHLRLHMDFIQFSSNHCRLEFRDGSWRIIDSSTNGTFLNGEKLVKNQPTSICLGDVVRLSTTATASQAIEFRFELDADAAEGNGDNTPEPSGLQPLVGQKRKAMSDTITHIENGAISSAVKRQSTPPPQHVSGLAQPAANGYGSYQGNAAATPSMQGVPRHASMSPLDSGVQAAAATAGHMMSAPGVGMTGLMPPPPAATTAAPPGVAPGPPQGLVTTAGAAAAGGALAFGKVTDAQALDVFQSNQELRQQIRALKHQLATAGKEEDRRTAAIKEQAKEEVVKAQERAARLEESLREATAKLAEAKAAATDVPEMKSKLQDKESKLSQAQKELWQLRSALNQAQREKQEVEERLVEAQEQASRQAREVAAAEAELAELRAAASSTSVVLADKDRRIAELSRALEAAQHEAAAAKQEVEGLRSAHDATGDLQMALEEAQEQAQERGELVSVLRGVARTSWEESNASLGHMKSVASQFTGMVAALENMLSTRFSQICGRSSSDGGGNSGGGAAAAMPRQPQQQQQTGPAAVAGASIPAAGLQFTQQPQFVASQAVNTGLGFDPPPPLTRCGVWPANTTTNTAGAGAGVGDAAGDAGLHLLSGTQAQHVGPTCMQQNVHGAGGGGGHTQLPTQIQQATQQTMLHASQQVLPSAHPHALVTANLYGTPQKAAGNATARTPPAAGLPRLTSNAFMNALNAAHVEPGNAGTLPTAPQQAQPQAAEGRVTAGGVPEHHHHHVQDAAGASNHPVGDALPSLGGGFPSDANTTRNLLEQQKLDTTYVQTHAGHPDVAFLTRAQAAMDTLGEDCATGDMVMHSPAHADATRDTDHHEQAVGMDVDEQQLQNAPPAFHTQEKTGSQQAAAAEHRVSGSGAAGPASLSLNLLHHQEQSGFQGAGSILDQVGPATGTEDQYGVAAGKVAGVAAAADENMPPAGPEGTDNDQAAAAAGTTSQGPGNASATNHTAQPQAASQKQQLVDSPPQSPVEEKGAVLSTVANMGSAQRVARPSASPPGGMFRFSMSAALGKHATTPTKSSPAAVVALTGGGGVPGASQRVTGGTTVLGAGILGNKDRRLVGSQTSYDLPDSDAEERGNAIAAASGGDAHSEEAGGKVHVQGRSSAGCAPASGIEDDQDCRNGVICNRAVHSTPTLADPHNASSIDGVIAYEGSIRCAAAVVDHATGGYHAAANSSFRDRDVSTSDDEKVPGGYALAESFIPVPGSFTTPSTSIDGHQHDAHHGLRPLPGSVDSNRVGRLW